MSIKRNYKKEPNGNSGVEKQNNNWKSHWRDSVTNWRSHRERIGELEDRIIETIQFKEKNETK